MDITMCSGEVCMLKEGCKRFTEIPAKYQSWFSEVSYNAERNKCEFFWSNNLFNAIKDIFDETKDTYKADNNKHS